jgi:hypothetical protein
MSGEMRTTLDTLAPFAIVAATGAIKGRMT